MLPFTCAEVMLLYFVVCAAPAVRVNMDLIKPAVDWRKAGVKVNTMGAAVAAKA